MDKETKKEKAKNLINMAIKAGRILFGEDNFFRFSKKNKVKLVILDNSLSERAKEKITKMALSYLNHNRIITYSDDLGNDIKSGVKVISITDENFARPISELLR